MISKARRLTATLLAVALLLGPVQSARAAVSQGESQGIGSTPPRLSYASGEVSFWRPGAADWAPAQINTPLAPGDELYTGNQGNLELQVGGRAFVRAWGGSQIGLANQEPDFIQLKITSGHVSVDLRGLDPGRTVEVDTPQAAFLIEHTGYYRVDVTPERTTFITRRGGRATMTASGGQALAIAPSEEIVLEGTQTPGVQSYVAPDLDTWDRWNYARTDELIESVSARYVSSDVYGVDDLDHYGNWRVVESYGPVWVPEAVPAGWVPYTTGRWVWDPFYGWTWVDTVPWGWAPFHYGRWVFVNGYWGWAPGPIVVRPAYAPALVAFFGVPGVQVTIGAPLVSWVALGWGEPVIPWWGRAGFVGRAWWGGWGGPRVVNNVVVNRTTVVNVNNITVYRNAGVQNAVVAVPQDRFGRAAVHEARVAQVDPRRLEPVRGPIRVTPQPASFVAASGRATRPPEAALARPVVATRPPVRPEAARVEAQGGAAPTVNIPAPRIVSVPKAAPAAPVMSRPPFGASSVERPRRPEPPRFEGTQQPGVSPPAREGSRRPEGTPPAPRGQQPTPPAEGRGNGEPKGVLPGGSRPEVAPPPPRGQSRAPEPSPVPEQRREKPPVPQSTPPPPGGNGEAARVAPARPEMTSPPQRGQSRAPESAPVPEQRREKPQPPQPATPPPAVDRRGNGESVRRAPAPAPVAPAPQRVEPPRPSAPAAPAPQKPEPPHQAPQPLPGEPANRLYPGHGAGPGMRQASPAAAAPHPAPPARPAPAPTPTSREHGDRKEKP